jgi:hypothetical protein
MRLRSHSCAAACAAAICGIFSVQALGQAAIERALTTGVQAGLERALKTPLESGTERAAREQPVLTIVASAPQTVAVLPAVGGSSPKRFLLGG